MDSSRGERIAALEPDFWRYWCERDEWELISADTKVSCGQVGKRAAIYFYFQSEGGPELIHDHQMVIDADNQTLYVFGGKVQNASLTGDLRYSGLYSYDISTNHWNLMLDDDSQDGPVQLKSRSGHSMLFDPQSREIYIFAGQRQKECLADVFAYDVDSGLVHEVARDFTKLGGPEPGFTDRSTIDPQLGEIYVMSGLLKEKNASEEMVKSCFWVYNFRRDLWTKVYQNDQESENKGDWARPGETEPAPRYAHQMVYDPVRKCQMLFGGNPGDPVNPRARLDDFWELWLFRSVYQSRWMRHHFNCLLLQLRPTLDDIVRRCRFYIRRQHFRELCAAKDQARALRFLQTNMNEVVNHANEDEAKEFRELTGLLFSPGVEGAGGMVGGKGRKKEVIRERELSCERHACSELILLLNSSDGNASRTY